MGSGEIDWGTVERSDGPLSDTGTQPEVLEVPSLTDEALDAMERENAEALQASLTDQPTEPVQTGEPGSQVECVICGKSVRVKQDGHLSKHKCEPKAQRGNRFEHLPTRRAVTPRKVRDFGINLIAYAVEEGSARALARPLGADPDTVPTELPDAEGMIGPPLDLLWPQIPDSAQKFISACADNSDLIACALAWGEWFRNITEWTRDQRAYNARLAQERNAHATQDFAGTDGIGRVVPFSPN